MRRAGGRLQARVLPYLALPTLGPITSFGIFAMLGVHFGSAAAHRHGARLGLPPEELRRMIVYCGIGGILGAHYVDLLLYQPGWSERPDAVWAFLNPFGGISSYGGLLGGTLGFFAFARRRRGKRLRYADVAALGVLVLLVFGRAGCASVHDHVGVATSFPLAVDFPRGNPAGVVGPHHDLGLYECALLVVLVSAALLLARRPPRDGLLVGCLALAYAVPRFALDFLRREIDNPRYGGLTPAQWGCLVTIGAGVAVLVRVLRRGPETGSAPTPDRRSRTETGGPP